MKHFLFLVIPVLFIILIGCKTVPVKPFHPANKIRPELLQSDFSLLQKILEANHPSLYWYTPKDSVDAYFAQTMASLSDSLTEKEFKNKVAAVISKIKCGHTVVRHSRRYSKHFEKQRTPVFPLALKIWKGSAVVVGNLFRSDSILKRGTIVTGINNLRMPAIIDSMFSLMSTDGNAINFKYQVISFNFSAYYRNAFNLDSQYIIHYIDSTGKNKEHTIKNYFPKPDTGKLPAIVAPYKISKKEEKALRRQTKRSLYIDTSLSTAIISINTFGEGRLQGFYRKSFKTIQKQNIQNLVLDLRQNSGGNILSSTKLTQYLADKPFKVADTVAAISRQFKYGRHIQPWFLYWLSMHFTGKKMNDDRIHFRYFENHYFKPKKKNHFNGKVYVVTGGYTFSAATLITGNLKDQSNVTVLGEETGGGAYGNSAMHLPVIVLPKTNIRVTLPMYRLVINSRLPKNGRGIVPDVEVGPSSYMIQQGIDAKLNKVRELIIASKK